MKILWVMAGNSDVPYFRWFADSDARRITGIEMDVLLFSKEISPKIYNCSGFNKVYQIKNNPANSKADMIMALLKAIRFFYKKKYDIVHSHLFFDALPTSVACKICKQKKFLVTKADSGFHHRYAPKGVIMDRLINKLSDRLVCISSENAEIALDIEHAKHDDIEIIHHGLPTHYYKPVNSESIYQIRKKYNIGEMCLIGSISRFVKWKGQEFLINAWSKCYNRFPTHKLLLIGQGPTRTSLVEAAKLNGIPNDRIQFIDRVSPDDVPALLSALDLFVHTASIEPFGLVIAEAMLVGTPVLSTSTGAARDAIVNNSNGWLIEYPDLDILHNYIIKIMKYPIEKRRMIGFLGRERALSMYNIDKMVLGHYNLYSSLVK
jgi:glycosyltransferase involved in cell wall biosynthesis